LLTWLSQEGASFFRDLIEKRISAFDANQRLIELMPSATFSNRFLHGQPGCQRISTQLKAHHSNLAIGERH